MAHHPAEVMVVDQARNHGPPHQVHPPGICTGKLRHLLIGADRYDAIAPDRHRLCDGKAFVNGYDLSVRENQIRRRLLREQRHAGKDNREQR
jgi:hypothetical protein